MKFLGYVLILIRIGLFIILIFWLFSPGGQKFLATKIGDLNVFTVFIIWAILNLIFQNESSTNK